MNKNITKILIGLLISISISCNSNINESLVTESEIMKNQTEKTIYGKVDFENDNKNSFSTKSEVSEIAKLATISVIYPQNHPTKANQTVVTGLTDEKGNFFINPSDSFDPKKNDIFLLEAKKRFKIGESSNITINTYIMWNGLKWVSITKDGLLINQKTTALVLISSFQEELKPENMIGKISDGNLNESLNENKIKFENLIEKINELIKIELDPIEYITYKNENYLIKSENPNKQFLLQNKECIECDLSKENLSNLDLQGINLNGSNLSNANLQNTNFKGANLDSVNFDFANLTGATWTNGNICQENSIGYCNEDIYITDLEYNFSDSGVYFYPNNNLFITQATHIKQGETSYIPSRKIKIRFFKDLKVTMGEIEIDQYQEISFNSKGDFIVLRRIQGSVNNDYKITKYDRFGNKIFEKVIDSTVFSTLHLNEDGSFFHFSQRQNNNDNRDITKTLYFDLFNSDGSIRINKEDFSSNVNLFNFVGVNISKIRIKPYNNNNNFIFKWENTNNLNREFFFQKFNSSGKIGDPIQTESNQIAINNKGSFVTLKYENGATYFQKYTKDGNKNGLPIIVKKSFKEGARKHLGINYKAGLSTIDVILDESENVIIFSKYRSSVDYNQSELINTHDKVLQLPDEINEKVFIYKYSPNNFIEEYELNLKNRFIEVKENEENKLFLISDKYDLNSHENFIYIRKLLF